MYAEPYLNIFHPRATFSKPPPPTHHQVQWRFCKKIMGDKFMNLSRTSKHETYKIGMQSIL